MKLYIPTCTLNFNNILTTESISPAVFYARRGFGNKRYYKVEANDVDNVIMLYSKFPQYNVEISELGNSPMVIEIDTDYCPGISHKKLIDRDNVEVYTSASTIYLTPFNCSFYFESYQELQTVLTNSEQSLEIKYSKLYSSNFKIHQNKSWLSTSLFSDKDYFEWSSSFAKNAETIPAGDARKDLNIDIRKGFLVCYLIGANTSVSPEMGRLKQLARKIRNILSAIVNSPEHKPTDIQDEVLLSLVKEFNNIYSNLDEDAKYNSELIDKKLISPSTGLSKEDIKKVLSDLGLTKAFLNQLNLRSVYNANDVYNCLYSPSMSDSFTTETNRMNDAIRRIEKSELANNTKLNLSDLVNIEDGKIKIKDPKAGTEAFFPALLESQMNGDYKQFMEQNNVDEPLAVAFVGGAKLKSLMPDDKWEGSELQRYVNGLLSNLQKGEAFDLFSIDNPIMQSFAAFCQKGEEIDRLKDYMLQMGFGDYQFALAIYGATRGFASLPKTFTSNLLRTTDYYLTFYKELCKLLFNEELMDIKFPSQKESQNYSDYTPSISSTIISKINQIEPKQSKQAKVVDAVEKSAYLEDQVHSSKAFMYIADNILSKKTNVYKALKSADFENDANTYFKEQFREKILSIIKSALPSSKASRKDMIEKIDKIIELEAKRQEHDAFICILDNYLKPTDAAYKKIRSILINPQIKNSSTPNCNLNIQTANNSITYTVGTNFVFDRNCWNFLQRNIPQTLHEIFLEDLTWFQNEFAKGDQSYYYHHISQENPETIEAFIRYISKKPYAKDLRLEDIKTSLREKYVR